MFCFIKNSFIFKFFQNIVVFSFKKSYFYKFLKTCLLYLKNSFIYKCFFHYFNKKPYFIHSISYKIFRKLVSFFDFLAVKIYNFFIKIYKKIFKCDNTKQLALKTKKDKINFLLLIFIFISFGYLLTKVLIKKEYNIYHLDLFTYILFIFIIVNATNLTKQSKTYKILKYFFN